MSTILFTEQTTPSAPTVNKIRLFIDSSDSTLKSIDSFGTVTPYVGASVEYIQDTVGAFISAGSTKVIVNYNDIGNVLTIDVDPSVISHTSLLDIGTNTHAQIDTHIADTTNPHAVTKSQVGLSNVDNTSDVNKPISTATQTALNLKSDLASPTFTGVPAAPTASPGTNTTQLATTAFVTGAVGSSATPDATTSVKGKVKLAGDLAGTADLPTVPGLASKVTSNTAITGDTHLKITYDSKGLVTAGTTANLNDLSDVAISAPATMDHLVFNGTNWTNQPNTPSTSGGAGVNFFFTATASGISTYDLMSKTPDANAEVDESIVVNNNTLAFEQYISDVTLGASQIDAGIWNFNFYTYVSAALGTTKLLIDVYKRTSGGTETLLFTADSGDITETVTSLHIITSVQPAFTINSTDKLLFKIRATTTSVTNVTIHLVHSGTDHYTYVNTPLILRHNDLAGLQGGSSTQFYHLNSSEYTGTGTGTFVRTTSPNITTPTGIVKADVGLGNVDNTSDATKDAALSTLTNKYIDGTTNTLLNIDYSSLSLTNSIVSNDIVSLSPSKLSTFGVLNKIIGTDNITGLLISVNVTPAELLTLAGITTGTSIESRINAKANLISPSFTTPNIGAATGTSLSISGQLTSTLATGTAPLVVASTTQVANLYSSRSALADTVTTNANLTGPVTSSGNATSITANAVTNAMLAQIATQTFKGRTTAATGNVEDLTATQATAILNDFVGDSGSGGTKGLVVAPAIGDATKFLKGNGTWATPATGAGMAWTTITASNTTTVLTSGSDRGILINGTVGGQKIQLPDATTMTAMDAFEVINNSNLIVPIYNTGSVLLGVVWPEQSVEVYPTDISTSNGVWYISTYGLNYDQQPPLFDDFISAGTATNTVGNLGWTLTTGAVAYQVSTNPRMGVARVNTSTANNGSSTLSLGTTSPIVLGGGRQIIEFYVKIPTLGGTGSAAFTVDIGLQDTTGSNETANGVYMSYAGTAAGTINWNCKTSAASTRTSTSSGTAAAAGTWVKFTIVVNPTGTNVDYYVDNLFVAAITTNIPTAPIAPNIHVYAGATNNAAKSIDIDFYKLQTSSTTAR